MEFQEHYLSEVQNMASEEKLEQVLSSMKENKVALIGMCAPLPTCHFKSNEQVFIRLPSSCTSSHEFPWARGRLFPPVGSTGIERSCKLCVQEGSKNCHFAMSLPQESLGLVNCVSRMPLLAISFLSSPWFPT